MDCAPRHVLRAAEPAWLDFTGFSSEQAQGDGWARAVHPEDLARWLDTCVRAFDAREPYEIEYRLQARPGREGARPRARAQAARRHRGGARPRRHRAQCAAPGERHASPIGRSRPCSR
ncbi:MAG: PAS domain-containing protein [Pseudomonadota bacterium]|nr:PAS domain-containing protein [Pseudomonadota bacterium]